MSENQESLANLGHENRLFPPSAEFIAQANAQYSDNGVFENDRVKARYEGDFPVIEPEKLDYIDIAPNQITSIAASLIPFLEHDDANRALMGSNMQRQAVPLIIPEAPIVGTGLEGKAARDARIQIHADGNGVVEFVDANEIHVRYDRNDLDRLVSFSDDLQLYKLTKFIKTNQATCINLRPAVKKGQKVKKGDLQLYTYVENGGQAGHKSAWMSEQNNLLCNDFFSTLLPVMENGYIRPRYNGYLYFQDHAGILIQDFILNKRALENVLSEINKLYIKSLSFTNK